MVTITVGYDFTVTVGCGCRNRWIMVTKAVGCTVVSVAFGCGGWGFFLQSHCGTKMLTKLILYVFTLVQDDLSIRVFLSLLPGLGRVPAALNAMRDSSARAPKRCSILTVLTRRERVATKRSGDNIVAVAARLRDIGSGRMA